MAGDNDADDLKQGGNRIMPMAYGGADQGTTGSGDGGSSGSGDRSSEGFGDSGSSGAGSRSSEGFGDSGSTGIQANHGPSTPKRR